MPPKAKFTEEEIIAAALEITRAEGISAVTARAIGNKLGSSARPIFTLFQSMDEVQQKVVQAAKAVYTRYVEEGLRQESAFRGVGLQYVRFAIEEPKLFQFLFMAEQEVVPDVSGVLAIIEDNYEEILVSAQKDHGLDRETASRFYQQLWIFSHGIATLCATKMCRFDGAEIGDMLREVSSGILKNIRERDKGKK